MSKILLVSWGVYPLLTGSTVVVNNIASQFDKDELVIFGEGDLDKSPEGWPDHFPKIYYTNPNFKIRIRDQSVLRWLNIKSTINEICKAAKKEKVSKMLCIFPDDFYLYAAYKASKKLDFPLFT